MMSDEHLLINVEQEEEEGVEPLFTIVCGAAYTGDDNKEMDFRFQSTQPQEPNVLDWITFLFLARHKMDTLYTAALETAINSYLTLREGVGADAARTDIESYVATRCNQEYSEENPMGLRDTDEKED